jgi:HK97 family phage portal protein
VNIDGLFLLPANTGTPYVASDGSVFYAAQRDPMQPEPEIDGFFPARDVLHVRVHTPRHPLIGETPLTAAQMSVSAGNAISEHMSGFFQNMTRPSGYLASPRPLKPEIAAKMREEWERAYTAGNSGKVAVLLDGLEWKPMSITSVDAELIDSYKMTVADIARVYRVPLVIIGEMGGATFNNTESLIRHWLSTGLGFMLEHIELALDALFELPPDEFMAFDVEHLLRADFSARTDGLVKGVQGGVFSPNEARRKEGLPAVAHGDEPRLQAQVVPLSFAGKMPTAPTQPTAPSVAPKSVDASMLDFLRKPRDAA